MDVLSELCSVCQLANTERVTERKKQTEKLIQMLNGSAVMKALDRNMELKTSDNKATAQHSCSLFGWDTLFKVAREVMLKDVDLLKSRGGPAGTAAPQRRRKDDMCSFFKVVVRLANKCGHWLNGSEVVSHIVDMISEDCVRESFGTDLSKVLLRDILEVHKYWCQLSSKQWSQLLHLYCVILKESPPGLDNGVLAEVIHVIVVGACQQSDVRVKKILPLFLDYFSRVKEESSPSVLEHVVSSINVLSRSIAINGRVQVSRLGETIFIPLFYLWKNQHNDRLKDEIVNFLQLQMSIHHPHGARTEEEGAFSVNSHLWKGHLRKIYEMVYTELEEFGDRSRFITSSRESRQTELKANIVELAVDVCHQLFTDNISMIEVTQNSFEDSEFGCAAKKRRIDSGWEVIRNKIASTGPKPQVTPWLQLLTRLLEKYPTELPTEQLPLVLGTLQQIVVDSRRRDIMRWALKCLYSLARSLSREHLRGSVKEQCRKLWQKVYLATIRLLSLQHTKKEGFLLLTTLLQDQLVSPTCDVWSLFIPTLSPCSQAGIHFIASYLSTHELTEDYHPNILVSMETAQSAGCSYPLRHQLLDWMLPSGEDFGEGRVSQGSDSISDWTLLAETLVTLTERDTHLINMCKSKTSEASQDELSKIEAAYLQMSFDLPLEGPNVQGQPGKHSKDSSRGSHLAVVRKRLEELLQRDATAFLNVFEPDMKQLEQISAQCCILVKYLYSMLCHGLLTVQQVEQSALFDTFKRLLKRLATGFTDLLRKDGPDGFTKVVATLIHLYSWPDDTSLIVHEIAELARSVTPMKLISQLLSIASNELATATGGGSPTRNTAASKFDVDFEFCGSSDVNGNERFDDSANTDFDMPDTNGHNVASCEKPMSDVLLTQRDRLRLSVVRLLCRWCSHENGITQGGCSSLSPTGVKKGLLDLLGEEKDWDPFDLQMVGCVIDELFQPTHSVSDEETEVVLTALWFMFRTHRRDQSVCQAVLQLLCRLVPHLSGCSNSELVSASLRDSRKTALHILEVFWRLSQQGQYVNETRMWMAQCLYVFIQCDPELTWTIWRQEQEGSGDAEEGDRPLLQELPQLLKDSHPGTRLMAATAAQMLFSRSTTDGFHSRDCHVQDHMFDLVYTALQSVIVIEGRRSPDEQRDEALNRRSSVLHTLLTVARVSAVCEKKAIFAICQMAWEHHFDMELVIKVLHQVCECNDYSSVESFTSSHLPYLSQQWLLNCYSITDFPYQLFDYRRLADFYKAHYSTIVPLLVMQKDIAAVKTVAETIGSEWCHLLEACMPKVLVHILPLFAMSKCGKVTSLRNMQTKVEHATACYDSLVAVVKQESIDKCVVTHLDNIVVDILMTLHENQASVDRFTRDYDPEPNPPQFDTDTIITTLDYLTKGHGGSVKSLVELLSKSQDSIQNILLALKRHLASAHRLHEKCRVLRMYRLFVSLLLREFHLRLGGSWAFVLRDVIYTLLHNLHSAQQHHRSRCVAYNTDLLCMSCDLLHSVCEVAVQHCPAELGRFLSAITSTLIPYMTEDSQGEVSRLCGQLLRFLLVDSAGGLWEAIHLLDPLPRVSVFSDARKICTKLKYNKGPFSLLQEINRFLLVSERGEEGVGAIAEGRLEGLLFLQHQLSISKDQLPHLVTQVKEQSLVNPLVSLVYKLIQLSQSPHERVAQEAGRCLAEIGPTDLQIVAIKGQCCKVALSAALSLYDHDQRLQQYCEIFHLLDDYLNDSSIQVVCAASQVLKAMLATKTGMSFHQGYKGCVKDSLFQYLHPFKPARKKVMPMLDVDMSEDNFVNTIDDDSLWVPHNTNHPTWVTQLVCQLIRSRGVHDELLCLLAPVCQVKTKLCEVVLPFLVHDILLNGSKKHTDVLSRQIGRFFEQHCGMLEKTSSRPVTPHTHTGDSQEGESICTNKASMQVMLNVIQYLRLQERQLTGATRPTPWDNNWWLDVDYLQVAKAAQSCSAYFTTLLYSEIWCDTHRDSDKSSSPPSSRDKQNSPLVSSQSSQLETLSALSDEGNINVQELMLEAYHSIGDPDGIYGCGAGRLADTVARIQTYEHENDWSKALCSYDLQFSQATASVDQANLLQALQNFGTSHVLDMYLLGLSSQSDISSSEVQDFQYHAACRNANWNIKVPVRLEPTCSYDKAVYTGLRALRETDTTTAMAAFKLARDATLRSLGAISMESARSLYPLLSKLQCITELEDLTSCVTGGGHQLDPSRFDHTLHKWSVQSNIMHNDYKFIEPIISQRCVLLQLLLDQSPADTDRVMDGLLTQLCQLARLARDAGRHQVAERAVHQLHHLAGAMVDESWEWRIEEARMFWARGEHITAKYLMRTIIDKLEKGRINLGTFYPECLGIYGDWLAETCSEAPNTIMEKYLQKAVTLLEEHGSADRAVLDAFLSLARYADGQYQHIMEYMHCGSFEAKQLLIRQAKEEVNQLKSVGEKSSSQTDELSRYLRTLEKQQQLDEQELESMMADRRHFLSCALSNYLKCLKFGDRHDMRVFRVTSLWFDNASQPEINESIQRGTEQIKSCKFLPLMYQLAARMGVAQPHSPSQFYPTLNSLIEKVVLEHPYHTLFIILALANANKDNDMVSERSSSWRSRLSKNKSSSEEEPETQQGRMQAAVNMIESLRQSRRVGIIQDMEKLCEAYIQLANWDVSQYKNETKAIKLPSWMWLTKLNDLETIAIPTLTTKVDPAGEYTDVVCIKSFESAFKLAGGINLPKIITCLGSDGLTRRQLVKGKDDLRQDAVMQQVFEVVNNLLQGDSESSRRRLNVRTYKVIPLSQRSGLLEWCEGTIPLGNYLCGSTSGAHERYRPHDLTALKCRKGMMGTMDKDCMKKHEVYLSLCDNFRPVFRHFFMERFSAPGDWYEKRLAYTRSVATNSIVGYIVGLGDRHVQNILIDCKTAELVHIDLGVAFEQGKILPTPETVPFRLTRDIVDGMGVSGVNGVFRRCCEKTMEVMHQSHEALLTILEVLLYDPLYVWTMSPQRACQLQQWREMRTDVTAADVSEIVPSGVDLTNADEQKRSEEGWDVNKVAERALLRVRQKLQGLENGVQLSVSGQVNQLIQAAINPKNLCRLFPGWQPYI